MDAALRYWLFLLLVVLSPWGFVLGSPRLSSAQVPGSQPLAQPPARQAPPSFQSPAFQQQQQQQQQPPGNPGGFSGTVPRTTNPGGAAAPTAQVAHPLDAEINFAKQRLATMQQNIQDYSCIFTKREQVDGKLLPYEQMFMKVRHHPFSVYMYFLGPEDVKGQQVVYVEGQNNGKMIAQPIGLKGKFGPYYLDPNGPFAMDGQRYPITNAGFVNLTKQLIAEGCETANFRNVR